MGSVGEEAAAALAHGAVQHEDLQSVLRRELEAMSRQLREGVRADLQQMLESWPCSAALAEGVRADLQRNPIALAPSPTPHSGAVSVQVAPCDDGAFMAPAFGAASPMPTPVSVQIMPRPVSAPAAALSPPGAAESPLPSPCVRPSASRRSLLSTETEASLAMAPEPHDWTQRHRRSFLGTSQVRKLMERDRSSSTVSLSAYITGGLNWFRGRMRWLDGGSQEWEDATGTERQEAGHGEASPTLLGRLGEASKHIEGENGEGDNIAQSEARRFTYSGSASRGKLSRVAALTEQGSPARFVQRKQVLRTERTDHALGLAHAKSDRLQHTEHAWSCRYLVRCVVRSWIFELFVMSFIFASAVQVGLQTDQMAKSSSLHVPPAHRAANIVFCAWFSFELALRLYVHRCRFFTMWGCGWNCFDMLLVVLQVTEEVVLAVENYMHHRDCLDDTHGLPNNTLLRTARILRVVKVMRVMRVMRYFEDLRLLVSCILHSVKPFFWVAALIFVIIYVVGTNLTHIVLVHRLVDSPKIQSPELEEYYGTVAKSIISMFQGLTGGVDWRDLLDPLLEHEGLHAAAVGVLLFLAFAILGVMNVVSGTFVQNAIERSEEVKEVNKVTQARKLFKCLDLDASGSISFEEIHDHLHSPPVQAFLKSIDVDVSEAQCLFQVMDMSGSGSIDFDEFLSACLRLQGPARALDLILLTRDSRRFFEQQSALLQSLRLTHSVETPPGSRR